MKTRFFTLFLFACCAIFLHAQTKTIAIYRNGQPIFEQPISTLDSVVFHNSINNQTFATTVASSLTTLSLTVSDLQTLQDGFISRRDRGYNDVKTKPYVPVAGSGPLFASSLAPYVRDSFYAMTDFAFKSLWFNQDLAQANSLLMGIAAYYQAHPEYLLDRDSFYWSADQWARLLEFYGRTGTKAVQRIDVATENALYALMWQYLNTYSPYAYSEYAISNTWDVDGSENHHAMQFMTFWHFSKLLKAHPAYQNLLSTESKTPSQLYDALTAYTKQWIRERAKKGLYVELANDAYNTETIKGLYNMYDFSADVTLKTLAGKYLDLYWALWAQESIDGVRGGGKARIYPGNDSNGGRTNFWKMAYYYLNQHSNIRFPIIREMNNMATSNYRMPLVVMDMALDKTGMSNFEINHRVLGLAKDNMWDAPDYRLSQTYGGVARYSYCTPSFIMGSLHVGVYSYDKWTMISSQNRWQGVIFYGDPNCRVYPQCKPTDGSRAYNQFWGVQSKGCMITQKLNPPYSSGADSMGIYISNEGFSKNAPITLYGWAFFQTDTLENGAYVAIKPLYGGCYWSTKSGKRWLMNKNPTSPVIIQVAQKSEMTYDQFRLKIKDLDTQSSYTNNLLTQKTINGDVLTFNTVLGAMPTINGTVINMGQSKTYDSPFVSSLWNSGVVTITKGSQTLLIDFNAN